jgi:hypothetical protein
LPGLKLERQDAFGGPICACRGSATGVAANHARDQVLVLAIRHQREAGYI